MPHITLVRPPTLVSYYASTRSLTPPLGLAYVASSLKRAGHSVTIVDAVGEAPHKVMRLFNGKMLVTGLSIPEILQRIP
ncbi:MAG TPA: hypothetical protein VNM22_17685, partial [Candidatus Limnocylindrales bacterium]|nr:hypothetical protein [Candidatus Limnocylindrales bacterium]